MAVPRDEFVVVFHQHEERNKYIVTPEERCVRVIHEELERHPGAFRAFRIRSRPRPVEAFN